MFWVNPKFQYAQNCCHFTSGQGLLSPFVLHVRLYMSSTNTIIYYSYGPRLVQKISHWLICFLDWMISLFILICISFFMFAVGLFFWSSSGNAHVAIWSLWISISYNGHPRSQEQPASINQYSSWYCILTQSGNYIFIWEIGSDSSKQMIMHLVWAGVSCIPYEFLLLIS